MSETPLSDLIAAHVASRSPETWTRMLSEFRKSQLGVFAVGAPTGTTGEFASSSGHPISVGLTMHAGSRPMALAFADPVAFAARFGRPFNAELSGEALFGTVLLNPECEGILINSALAEVSIVIERAVVESLVQPASVQQDAKPWWKFW